MTMAERMLRTQRENIKKANNARFEFDDKEYVIRYEGGIAEYVGIYGRKKGIGHYRFVDGFAGYKMNTAEQIVSMAKAIIANK